MAFIFRDKVYIAVVKVRDKEGNSQNRVAISLDIKIVIEADKGFVVKNMKILQEKVQEMENKVSAIKIESPNIINES